MVSEAITTRKLVPLREFVRLIRNLRILSKDNALRVCLRYACRHLMGIRGPISVRLDGVPLQIRPSTPDLSVAVSNLVRKEFEPLGPLVTRHKSFLIVDGGGYIGTAALSLARIFPDAQIVSLEPSAANYEILRGNVSGHSNITALHQALSPSGGPVELFSRGAEWGNTIVQSQTYELPKLETVDSVSIEGLLQTLGRDGIDVLKLDIEGAEKALFEASASWIHRVGIIMVELHDQISMGCTRSLYEATIGMQDAMVSQDKVIIVNEDYFSR